MSRIRDEFNFEKEDTYSQEEVLRDAFELEEVKDEDAIFTEGVISLTQAEKEGYFVKDVSEQDF